MLTGTKKKIISFILIIALIIGARYGIKLYKSRQYSTDTTDVSRMRKVTDVIDKNKVRKSYKNAKEGKDFFLEHLEYEEDEYSQGTDEFTDALTTLANDKYGDEPSEIEGMTKADKFIAGLDPESDDTDKDGLTDYEELYVYNSDPHTKYTSGDIYDDKYKIDHNMDINEFTDADGRSVDNGRNSEEVTLYPLTSDDITKGSVTSSTLAPGVNVAPTIAEQIKHITYKAYKVDNFTGDVKINLSSIFEENNITKDKIEVLLTFDTSRADIFGSFKADYKWDGEDVLVKQPMLNKKVLSSKPELRKDENTAYILITNKDKYNGKMGKEQGLAKLMLSYSENKYNKDIMALDETGMNAFYANLNNREAEPFGFLTSFPIPAALLHAPTNIYVVDTGVEELNQWEIDMLKKYYADDNQQDPHHEEDGYVKEGAPIYFSYKIHLMSEKECRAKFLALKPFSFMASKNRHEVMDENVIFTYISLDDIMQIESAKVNLKRKHMDENAFDFNTETFVFKNFKTDEVNGHCGGMALEVAYCHNLNGPEAEGNCDGMVVYNGNRSYEITTERNQTLLDRYLSDYQYPEYTDTFGAQSLKKGDEDTNEFIDMMDVMLEQVNQWDMENAYATYHKYNLKNRIYGGTTYRSLYFYGNVVPLLKKEIDNNRVAILSLSDFSSNFGHVVNVYDYEDFTGEDGLLHTKFYIYDSNYPGNDTLYLEVWPEYGGRDDITNINSCGLRYVYNSGDYVFTTDKDNNDYKMVILTCTYEAGLHDLDWNDTCTMYRVEDGEYIWLDGLVPLRDQYSDFK